MSFSRDLAAKKINKEKSDGHSVSSWNTQPPGADIRYDSRVKDFVAYRKGDDRMRLTRVSPTDRPIPFKIHEHKCVGLAGRNFIVVWSQLRSTNDFEKLLIAYTNRD